MDFCYMTLKANTHVEKASKSGFNNNVWVNQLAKSFKIDKSVNRLKLVVAFSVLTLDNGKETVIRKYNQFLYFMIIL